MSDPIAITGSLVDARNVFTHKCVRLYIDVPAEQAASIIKMFGWPTMVDPVPVAVARLNSNREPSAHNAPGTTPRVEPSEGGSSEGSRPTKAKRTWDELTFAEQAGIRCQEEAFWKFLGVENSGQAAELIRRTFMIRSRAAIIRGSPTGDRWHNLEINYQNWRAGVGLSPSDLAKETEAA